VCTRSKLLLLLGDGVGPSLGRCVQLPRIGKGPPGIGITLGDGLHLQVKTMLPGPHRRPLKHHRLLEHACPQLEAAALVNKVLTFTVQDTLRL
jgi:hypothetical protein